MSLERLVEARGVPDGQTVSSTYTVLGWLSSVATAQGNVTTANNLAYTGMGGAFGEITSMHLGGGYDCSASYDLLDRATDLKAKRTSDGTTMFDQARTFDGAGDVATAAASRSSPLSVGLAPAGRDDHTSSVFRTATVRF